MGKGRPQQQEISRSGRTPVDQDSYEQQAAEEEAPAPTRGKKPAGRLPLDNRPGHHPPKDQDKPEELGGAGHGAGKRKRRS